MDPAEDAKNYVAGQWYLEVRLLPPQKFTTLFKFQINQTELNMGPFQEDTEF